MTRHTFTKTFAVALAAAPGALLAHPGSHHALTGQQAAGHLVSDPWHVALIVAAAVAVVGAGITLWRNRRGRS